MPVGSPLPSPIQGFRYCALPLLGIKLLSLSIFHLTSTLPSLLFILKRLPSLFIRASNPPSVPLYPVGEASFPFLSPCRVIFFHLQETRESTRDIGIDTFPFSCFRLSFINIKYTNAFQGKRTLEIMSKNIF